MSKRKPAPGVSRDDRLSDEGLSRLQRQLEAGVRIAPPVLAQWIRRYGKPAADLIQRYGYQPPDV